MTDKVIRVKIEAGDSQQQIAQLDASMVKLGTSTDKTAAEITGLNTDLTKAAQGVKAAVSSTNEAVGNLGRSTGQAAMQIQQLVGQVQGGVSPFVALSQQAADLGFVLGFPLLGAVVGIGAALAGPLVAAFTQAEEKATAFDDALKGIINTQEEFKANKAQVQIAELNAEFDKQQVTIENLKRQQAQYIEAINGGTSSQSAYASALFQVDMALDSAQEKQAELAKKIEETTAASLSGKAVNDEQNSAITSLTSTLELQRVALEQGELEGRLYAAAQQLQLESVENLPPAIMEHILAIYELEQAQKAQKEAAAELLRINREQEQQAKQKARQDEEDARRAEREKQRINERIANMRLETQTLSAESELQRAVKLGQFTQEEADLASQTAARLLAANSEFEQTISMRGIQHEQIEAAEAAHQERIKAINEQYAEAQVQLKQYQFNREVQAYQGFANSAIQLVNAFGSKSFQAQKNAAIATSLVNIAGGVAQALNNPYPANLGFAAQVAAEGASLLSTIKSTNVNSGGGSISVGGSGSATIPTAPTAAPVVGSFEIAGLADLQRQLNNLDNDEVLPVSFTRRLVASLESVQRLDGAS